MCDDGKYAIERSPKPSNVVLIAASFVIFRSPRLNSDLRAVSAEHVTVTMRRNESPGCFWVVVESVAVSAEGDVA
jgi:hypothetical protein